MIFAPIVLLTGATLGAGVVGDLPGAPWSGDGHRIVCRIAWERLTPTARERAAEWIEADPRSPSFEDACVWADEIRAQIREGVPEVQRFAPYTPSHYMNTPPGSPGVAADGCTPPPRPEALPTPCVLDAITEFADSLVGSSDPGHRTEALKFLAHFVGDLHQPLHAGYGHDRGGNSVRVNVMGESGHNLHSVWDGFFIEHQDRGWAEYARDLAGRIRPVDEALWTTGGPLDWANESYQIVEDEVYRDIDPDGAYVGDLYFDRHVATVERQLRKAGVRLAHMLNTLLDPDNPT